MLRDALSLQATHRSRRRVFTEETLMSEDLDEESTTVQVGHKHGRVILNLAGTSELSP